MILSVFLCVSPAGAEDGSKNIEQYKANAMVRTGGGGGSMVEINIYRWSSDEERDEVRQAIKDAGNQRERRHVAQVLRGQERAGFAFRQGVEVIPCATLVPSTWAMAIGRSSSPPTGRYLSARSTITRSTLTTIARSSS